MSRTGRRIARGRPRRRGEGTRGGDGGATGRGDVDTTNRRSVSSVLVATLAVFCVVAMGCNGDGLVLKHHEFTMRSLLDPGEEASLLVAHQHWVSDFNGTHLRMRAEISQVGLEEGAQIAVPLSALETCMKVARAAGGTEVGCEDLDLDGLDLYSGMSSAMRVSYEDGDQIVDTWINVRWWDFVAGTSISETCRYHDWGDRDPAHCDVVP